MGNVCILTYWGSWNSIVDNMLFGVEF